MITAERTGHATNERSNKERERSEEREAGCCYRVSRDAHGSDRSLWNGSSRRGSESEKYSNKNGC
jgi:hypothetical protein